MMDGRRVIRGYPHRRSCGPAALGADEAEPGPRGSSRGSYSPPSLENASPTFLLSLHAVSAGPAAASNAFI
jgi:hypothetical protein